jgi:hypothetical protein
MSELTTIKWLLELSNQEKVRVQQLLREYNIMNGC